MTFPVQCVDTHEIFADADRVGYQVKYVSVESHPMVLSIAHTFYRRRERVRLVSRAVLLRLLFELGMVIELAAPHPTTTTSVSARRCPDDGRAALEGQPASAV